MLNDLLMKGELFPLVIFHVRSIFGVVGPEVVRSAVQYEADAQVLSEAGIGFFNFSYQHDATVLEPLA
jgi:hypothetical protein